MLETIAEKATPKIVPLTRIQKLIGRRMLASKRNKPCFYMSVTTDVTELAGIRPSLRKSLGVKITTNAFYMSALAQAAEKFPLMVGKATGQHIKIADSINVGFAVAAPQGLVVPVLRDAHNLPLQEIARTEKKLTEKARSNTLTLEDIENQTIALSNLGVYDIDRFLGIVPPTAGTILAVGGIRHNYLPHNGKPTVRKTVVLTLAVDRRVVQPVYAAAFFNQLKELLEDPTRLIQHNNRNEL